jgi:head-tail adaptor
MSQFRAHDTAIRRREALVEALVDRAKTFARSKGRSEIEAEAAVREHVQLHDEPVMLRQTYGSRIKETNRVAEVVLPQPHCRELLGCAQWEDIGFLRTEDDTYQALMSSHDQWWASGGESRFLQVAQANEALLEAELEGAVGLDLVEVDGAIVLTCDFL